MKNHIAKLLSCIMLIGAMLTGCATQKQWCAIGGSRSDGTIRIAYDYGMFEKPLLDQGQGYRLAIEKCRLWGYTSAELFGNTMQQCIAANQYGCAAWRVYADFQCTTNAKVAPIAPIAPVAPVFGPRVSNN
jgi:hypothetical protein